MALVEAQGVSKQFFLRHNASAELKVRFLGLLHGSHKESIEEFWALKDVSLRIDRGEVLGLIGRNGSGKSTFLKLIAAIYRPTTGRLLVARGARISSMIELGVGFHPELTGRENVFLNAAIHGLTRQETQSIYPAIVEYSGLQHFIDVPIKNYSSGMHMRLGFAIAANLNPDILLLDEIFAVGDADFQHQCVATLKSFVDQGRTIIFVSHAAPAVQAICRRACVLEQGELMFDGDVNHALAFYERLLAHRAEQGAGSVASIDVPADSEEPVPPLHTQRSSSEFDWTFELVRREGLRPRDRVLHVLNPQLISTSGADWATFLDPTNYVRRESCTAVCQADALPGAFDVAVVESILPFAPFNVVARCLGTIIRSLRSSGRLYATWYENPDAASLEPLLHATGITTYADQEPYHYPFALIASVCDAFGATVERVPSASHGSTGESLLVISRRR